MIKAVLFLMSAALLSGANRYASASASAGSGDGTIEKPWTLPEAFLNVAPGDTVWVRAGIYSGAFNATVSGTSGSRITFRNYPGEYSSWSYPTCVGADETLEVSGSYWTFKSVFPGEIRINNTCGTRTYSADFRSNGIEIQSSATGTEIIHVPVHDAGMGIVDAGIGTLVYGSPIFNNGKINTTGDKQNGHGLYPSSPGGSSVYEENIICGQYGFGVHAYGTTIANLTIRYNVTCRNGEPSGAAGPFSQILVNDSNGGATNISITGNYLYIPLDYNLHSSWSDFMLCLQCADPGVTGTTASVTGNTIVGPVYSAGWNGISFTGNEHRSNYGFHLLGAGQTPGTWNNNSYFGINEPHADDAKTFSVLPTTELTFAEWQVATTLDAASTYSATLPTTDVVTIRASAHDPARANVIAYNRDGNNTVTLDPRGFAAVGQMLTIKNAQNWLGAPAYRGVYQGGTITLALDVAPAAPTGGTALSADSRFGAFVMFKETIQACTPN